MAQDFTGPVYVSYDEARSMLPFFIAAANRPGVDPEAKAAAIRIKRELEMVRKDVGYEPFNGKQIFLQPRDKQWFLDVASQYEAGF